MAILDNLIPMEQTRREVINGVVTSTVRTMTNRYWYENKTGVRRHRPTGWRDPTSYNLDTYVHVPCRGTIKWRVVPGWYLEFEGALVETRQNLGYEDLPVSGLVNEALIKALTNLKSMRVNLGVAFAEAQQTADLVGSTASRIARAYNNCKRGRYKDALRSLGASARQVPNNWLEMQYAWKPLLSDVYGAVEALQTRDTPPDWRVTVKGAQRDTEKLQYDYFTGHATVRVDRSRMAGGFVRLDYSPGNTFLSSLTQVGMTNPLEVLWEKVPFSFIYDWFQPIGGWLSVMDAAYGWQFISGSNSSIQRTRAALSAAPPSGQTEAAMFDGGIYKAVKLKRNVYLSSPLPQPPRFKNPLSLGHMANGLSLLASAFGR